MGAGRKMVVGMYGSVCAVAVTKRQAHAVSITDLREGVVICDSFVNVCDPTAASPTGGDENTIPRRDFICFFTSALTEALSLSAANNVSYVHCRYARIDD